MVPGADEGSVTIDLPGPSLRWPVTIRSAGERPGMSQYYDLGDRTLWNPSQGVSRLFLAQLAAHEAEVGAASGVGPMEADACQVDSVAFAAFVGALLTWRSRSRHPVRAALSDGFLATALALAGRAGIEVEWPPSGVAEEGWAVALRRTARELARSVAP